MHVVLFSILLGASYLLDRIMKNSFEYEAELAALREENERLKSESFEELYNAAIDERDALREELANAESDNETIADHNIELQHRLTAAEQRNAELIELLSLIKKDGGFLTREDWDRVDAALKPTESGASE